MVAVTTKHRSVPMTNRQLRGVLHKSVNAIATTAPVPVKKATLAPKNIEKLKLQTASTRSANATRTIGTESSDVIARDLPRESTAHSQIAAIIFAKGMWPSPGISSPTRPAERSMNIHAVHSATPNAPLAGALRIPGLVCGEAFTLLYRYVAMVSSLGQPEGSAGVVACRVVYASTRTVSACIWLARYIYDDMLTRQRWTRPIVARNFPLNHKAISL